MKKSSGNGTFRFPQNKKTVKKEHMVKITEN